MQKDTSDTLASGETKEFMWMAHIYKMNQDQFENNPPQSSMVMFERKIDPHLDITIDNCAHVIKLSCTPIATVSIAVSYGHYSWCGNGYDGSQSGPYLSLTQGSVCDDKGKKPMITINTVMNCSLFGLTEQIRIYDNDGKEIHYSMKITEPYYKFRFTVDEKMAGTNLRIVYGSLKMPSSTFGRAQLIPQYNLTTKIPTIAALHGEKPCGICAEDLEPNKYITQCGHIFCHECIFGYFKNGDLLKTFEKCKQMCRHSPKPQRFNCPTCKKDIEA